MKEKKDPVILVKRNYNPSYITQSKGIICFIDWENVSRAVISQGKVVDLRRLRDFLVKRGPVIFNFICIPPNYAQGLPENVADLGYSILLFQKLSSAEKYEDRVDKGIADASKKFIHFFHGQIDQIIIVSNDRHFVDVIAESLNFGIKVVVIGTEEMSSVLANAISENSVYKLPTKGKFDLP